MSAARTEQFMLGSFRYLIESRELMFWFLQVLGWGALFIVSSLTLTLFYNEPSLPYIAHNLVKSGLGILLTWPMRVVYQRVWLKPLTSRLMAVIGMALLMSIIWTLLIIYLFQIMTGEMIELFDYGGWLYSSVFIFMSWAASYHGFKYYLLLLDEHEQLLKARAEEQHQLFRRSEAENQAKMAKLKFLSFQLNPHFLFNTLNSIYSLIEAGNNNRAKKMVGQLSQFLRASLAMPDDILVDLESELDTLERYLEIEKTRFGERLQVSYDCSEESLDAMIPVFLLQPLAENSIKHAISHSMKEGEIMIRSRVKNQRLYLMVEDSGHDRNVPPQSSEGHGIGLSNTQERLSVLYDNNFGLEMTDSDLGGTRVTIVLPYNQKDITND